MSCSLLQPTALEAIRHPFPLFPRAPSVTFAMTTGAKRYQVPHHIVTELAPAFYVMNLQAFHGTALLAPPAISLEHKQPDDGVSFRIQFESRLSLAETRGIQCAFHNQSFGSVSARFAPARKSAQIISRQ